MKKLLLIALMFVGISASAQWSNGINDEGIPYAINNGVGSLDNYNDPFVIVFRSLNELYIRDAGRFTPGQEYYIGVEQKRFYIKIKAVAADDGTTLLIRGKDYVELMKFFVYSRTRDIYITIKVADHFYIYTRFSNKFNELV